MSNAAAAAAAATAALMLPSKQGLRSANQWQDTHVAHSREALGAGG